MRGDTNRGLDHAWCWGAWLPVGGQQGGGGSALGGRPADQPPHWEERGHVLPELSEMSTVSCLGHTVSFTCILNLAY